MVDFSISSRELSTETPASCSPPRHSGGLAVAKRRKRLSKLSRCSKTIVHLAISSTAWKSTNRYLKRTACESTKNSGMLGAIWMRNLPHSFAQTRRLLNTPLGNEATDASKRRALRVERQVDQRIVIEVDDAIAVEITVHP